MPLSAVVCVGRVESDLFEILVLLIVQMKIYFCSARLFSGCIDGVEIK